MYKEQIVLLHAKSYEVYDDVAKETNRGITLRYINKGKLFPVNNTKNGMYEGGYPLAKTSLPIEFVSKMQSVPAIYEASFDISVTSAGKTELKMQDLEFVRDIDLTDIAQTQKK